MSELRYYKLFYRTSALTSPEFISVVEFGKDDEVYLKSEADKVIAEKEDRLHNVSGILKETREWLIESQKLHKRCADNEVKVIRHQKYRRCLAMADYAMYHHFRMLYIYGKSLDNDKAVFKINYGLRWRSRWLALADRFKETK